MSVSELPIGSGLVDVGGGQLVYWEEWGNPEGVPALYVHGGPGGALGTSSYRHRFDLTRTRVVGFEQRGCGRSTPHAGDPETSLRDNNTAHLIGDMEAVRDHRGIDRWILTGVSWGSTLALAYAVEHPERVLGIRCSSPVTTTSRAEVDWITARRRRDVPKPGTASPPTPSRPASAMPADADASSRPTRSCWSRPTGPCATPHRGNGLWEDTHVSIGIGGFAVTPRWHDEAFRVAFFRLTARYWSHDGFCQPPILDRLDRLAGIPATLIHGRRDISSPAITPWRLHRDWPASELLIDEGDGHGGPSMIEHWRAANDALVDHHSSKTRPP